MFQPQFNFILIHLYFVNLLIRNLNRGHFWLFEALHVESTSQPFKCLHLHSFSILEWIFFIFIYLLLVWCVFTISEVTTILVINYVSTPTYFVNVLKLNNWYPQRGLSLPQYQGRSYHLWLYKLKVFCILMQYMVMLQLLQRGPQFSLEPFNHKSRENPLLRKCFR